MNRKIRIPCILIINDKEIEEAEKLGLPKPEEIYAEHNISFYRVDIVEEPYIPKYCGEFKIKTYVCLGGISFCSTLSEDQIDQLMIEAGWCDR